VSTMMMPSPARSREQQLEALRRANAIRSARARLKAQLRATPRPEATASTAQLVRQPVEAIDTMKVAALIGSCPGMGPVATRNLLRRLHISPSKTIVGLSPRQRQQLGVALDELARRRRQTAGCRG
jgi:hypothetical protein